MIFLLHYERSTCHLVLLKAFDEDDRATATEERVDLEIRLLGSRAGNEVVLLEAESEDELKKTHRRYFTSIGGLTKNASGSDGLTGRKLASVSS